MYIYAYFIKTSEDDKVILLKYIWKLFFDSTRDQQASTFPVYLFFNPKDFIAASLKKANGKSF